MEARWDLLLVAYLYFTANYFKTIYDQGGKEKYEEFMKEQGRTEQGLDIKDLQIVSVLLVTMPNQRLQLSRSFGCKCFWPRAKK